MTNYLMVDKELFQMDLGPLGILIISQILEFERTTGKCFISNETLANNFNVSESTIKREISKLEAADYLIRETKSMQRGKERTMRVDPTKVKLTPENREEIFRKSNLTLPHGSDLKVSKVQNDPIKEKTEEKKGKTENSSSPALRGTRENPIPAEIEWLLSRNLATKVDSNLYQCTLDGLYYKEK